MPYWTQKYLKMPKNILARKIEESVTRGSGYGKSLIRIY